MRFTPAAVFLILLLPAASYAQRKEFVELQRDLGLLGEQIRTLQSSLEEKIKELTVLVQQSLDASNRSTTSVTMLEKGLREKIQDQERSLVAPVAALGAKVDQMSVEMSAMRETVAELNAKLSRLQTQLVDLSNAVKIMQSPPPPPGSNPASPSAAGGPPPGISAETLYRDAYRDKLGGKNELALQQFQDYVNWFPNTDLAPSAQYFIGEIYYNQGNFEEALKAFDAVLERFPDNARVNDALLMKGRTLVKLNQRTAAAEEFRALLKRQPTGDYATKANAELKNLGLNPPGRRPTPAKKRE
jgi:TolA-binding protein